MLQQQTLLITVMKNGAQLSGALKSISKLVSLGTVRNSVFLKHSHRHCLLVKIWNTSSFENSAAFNIKILTVIVLKFSAAGRVTVLADDDLLHLKKALLVSGREALGEFTCNNEGELWDPPLNIGGKREDDMARLFSYSSGGVIP